MNYLTHDRSNGGPRFWRARFAATALGLIGAFAVGSRDAPAISLEKTLIRWERDFGWVVEDMGSGTPPEDYQKRVVRAEQEICSRWRPRGSGCGRGRSRPCRGRANLARSLRGRTRLY